MDDPRGHLEVREVRQRLPPAPAAGRAARRGRADAVSKCTCSERMPGVRSSIPGTARSLQLEHEGVHPRPAGGCRARAGLARRAGSRRPAADRPSPPAGSPPRSAAARRAAGTATPPAHRRAPASRSAPPAPRPAARRLRRHRDEAHAVAWLELARASSGRRAPPSRGRRSRRGSGRPGRGSPACHRCSPRPRSRRRCRGCSRGAAPPRRRPGAPTRASGRSAGCRCGWSCSGPPSRRRRRRRCRRSVKNSGAPCGPLSTRSSQWSVSRGLSASGSAAPALPPRSGAEVQHVTGAQRPARVAAEAAEREGRPAAQVRAATSKPPRTAR